MNPVFAPVIGGIVEAVGKVADDLFTSDKERLEAQIKFEEIGLEAAKVDADLVKAQIEVNREEAKHRSIFVAGWRPAIGWTGVAGLVYQFLVQPSLVWVWRLGQANGYIPTELDPPPSIDFEPLMTLLIGILGIGTLRTYEKVKRVSN